jgi:hypothetical protein
MQSAGRNFLPGVFFCGKAVSCRVKKMNTPWQKMSNPGFYEAIIAGKSAG